MKRVVGVLAACALIGSAALWGPAFASSGGGSARTNEYGGLRSVPTVKIAGPQHWCGSNGVNCAEPLQNWEEFAGYDKAKKAGAKMLPYIGHDEPALLFYSNTPGSGNDVTYSMRLPTDPTTNPTQTGSGGTYDFERSITFWLGMIMCDANGSPNPGGVEGHPQIPCTPDSDSNIYASEDPNSPKYFGFGPGQAFMEMQFYPPGWVAWPAGTGCTARQWCAALNIDTFQDNSNTGAFNNTACLNTAGPEPVNFAFLTNDGVATAPADPLHPEHFVPDPGKDFLMNPGDKIRVQMNDTKAGFKVVVKDKTLQRTGSMTASVANGFGTVRWDPSGSSCQVDNVAYHPMYSTSTPETRNFNAAHTYNVSASDEIGHFELCGKVKNDALGTCAKPLGADTNDKDNKGPDPEGDDVFCLPKDASLLVRIGGCLNTDGDFDGVSYDHTWPGSITNPTADHLLNGTPMMLTSPLTNGKNFDTMAFESDASRNESDDTAFDVFRFCQRHITNPADPHPGKGCVNPPPGSRFYPLYTTIEKGGTCFWQQGGTHIPGTTDTFGGSAQSEYGPLRVISYPTAPTGTITTRYNDFRSDPLTVPCKA